MAIELPLGSARLMRLTVRCLRTMTALTRGGQPGATIEAARVAAGQTAAEPRAVAGIVLEGEVGATVAAAFVVENHLEQRISAPLVISPRAGEPGRAPEPQLRLDPGIVTLEPHERALVRVLARIDEALVDGPGYRGAVAVPGLPGTQLAITVRHIHTGVET